VSTSLKGLAAGGTALALLGLGAGVAAAGYPSTPAPTTTTAPAKVAAPAKALTVSATLTPAQEVPKPTGKLSATSGSFTGTMTPSGKLTYTLTFKGLSGPATASHLHKGKPGTSGPVVVPLCPPGCTSPLKGTKTVSKSFLAAMKGGDAYVNVHTKKNPGGEIRGLVKVR
jgi:CHRD domain